MRVLLQRSFLEEALLAKLPHLTNLLHLAKLPDLPYLAKLPNMPDLPQMPKMPKMPFNRSTPVHFSAVLTRTPGLSLLRFPLCH